MATMTEAGVESAPGPKNGNGHADNGDAAWWPIHACAMTRYEKNGRPWYSRRVEGEKWCKGK